MVAPPLPNLKRKASRWQTLPEPGEENGADIDVDNDRVSLLIFLRDLEANQDRWAEFMELLQNAPGLIDEGNIASQLLDAMNQMERVDYDYLLPDAPNAKKRRLGVVGNAAAADTLAEYSELILLARTLWNNPDQLNDIIGDLYQNNLGRAYGDENYELESIFDLARKWGEVRYRYLNHTNRDDPNYGVKYNTGHQLTKGNNANAMVHESDVLGDSKIVEFRNVNGIGFTPADRVIFEETYMLTPEEGRQILQASGPNSGLRIGLPQVFGYCSKFINAVIDWRVRVLEASRRQSLASTAYRQAHGQANKQAVLNARHQGNIRGLASVDTLYANDLIPALRVLLGEAQTQDAFNKASFDRLHNTVGAMIRAVQTSPMNTVSPELARNFNHTRIVNNFPGQIALIRPTGFSMITPRPPPRNRRGVP
ncbi:hypothetical protein NPX13_g10075 [Xylaria arbuscula]|uniref:Uncharacterized protein n=1 Tax=Xylaria arbuscula TaxID=114810 RepID=A0A9W8N579_9PEZI|nr:hypothetical protein NPX13_g10075 [Xylaria arbuscula]